MKKLYKNNEAVIKTIKEKLKNHNTPEINEALKAKLKILEGDKIVMK